MAHSDLEEGASIRIDVSEYTQQYIDRRKSQQKEATATEKALTARHFTEYCTENDIRLDTDKKYETLDDIRGFFDTGRLSLSGTRLYHIRDFIDYIASHLQSTRDQDKLLEIRDNLTKDRWPAEAFDTNTKDPEFIADESIEAACHAADGRGEIVIRFLFDTGCRLAEMCAVTVDDIDFDRGDVGAAIGITKKRTKSDEIEPPKSAAGTRAVELTEKTARMLQDYIERHGLESEDQVFWMSHKTYQKDVKRAFTDSGILLNDGPDADQYQVSEGKSFVSCHWLRHNRNTRIKQEYGPVAAQQYMGHEDTDMTDHYTHYDPDEVQGIVGTEN